MNAADHISAAESLANQATELDNEWSEGERAALALVGLTHALIAVGIELGAPHAAAPAGTASGG